MLTPAPGQATADAVGDVARALDPSTSLKFLRHLSVDDAYHCGPVPGGSLFVIPGMWASMQPALLTALRARRRASVTGRCPVCDAALRLTDGQMHHESACPVSDDRLRPMLAEWSRRVGAYARGRRILEDPA